MCPALIISLPSYRAMHLMVLCQTQIIILYTLVTQSTLTVLCWSAFPLLHLISCRSLQYLHWKAHGVGRDCVTILCKLHFFVNDWTSDLLLVVWLFWLIFNAPANSLEINWYDKFQLNVSKHVGEKCGTLRISSTASSKRGITPLKLDGKWRHSNLLLSWPVVIFLLLNLSLCTYYSGWMSCLISFVRASPSCEEREASQQFEI